jgi:hypothetical protein
MAKQWAKKFTVQAKHKLPRPFPIDMLSYDQCYPSVDSDSVSRIINSLSEFINESFESKPITLIHLSHGNKNWSPTSARWESFGYKVTNIQPAKEY